MQSPGIEPIPADNSATATPNSAVSVQNGATSALQPIPTALTVPGPGQGKHRPGDCVSVVGQIQVRTKKIAGAEISQVDCSNAHNGEIVEQIDQIDQGCERAVAAFVGFDSTAVRSLASTSVDFALVQDGADSVVYCVATYPNLPQYTGQLAGSKQPR